MTDLTRREFLKRSGAVLIGAALAQTGCSASPAPASGRRAATAPTGDQAYLAVARGGDAADAYAATLFDLTGADVEYLQKAAEMGLGTLDLERVKVEELSV